MLALACAAACSRSAVPCVSPAACSAGLECIANRCVPLGSDPVPADSERLVIEPRAVAVVSENGPRSGAVLPGAVTFGARAVGATAMYLAFAPRWRGAGSIDSAFLLLEPVAGALVDRSDVAVSVWRIEEDWQPEDVSWRRQPDVAPPRARGIARSSPPATLRIDVTRIVRYLDEHPRSNRGLAVKAPATGGYGATFGTGATGSSGPRLEVYVTGVPRATVGDR